MTKHYYRFLKAAAYRTPIYRWLGLGRARHSKSYWDDMLQGQFRAYLGGTISIDTRNAVTLSLIKNCCPKSTSILDIGCASGSLARSPGAEQFSYSGVDISEVAVNEGKKISPNIDLNVCPLEDYVPKVPYDVILFNEVLYYVSVDNAILHLKRYSDFLKPDGIIIVSMKHDPKSERIFKECFRLFSWLNGIIYQEKNIEPDYKFRANAEYPAYLIGVFKNFHGTMRSDHPSSSR